jgi:hypothetical protein
MIDLGKPNGRKVICPEGIEFNTITAMPNHYGVKRTAYYQRLALGWSIKAALGLPDAQGRKERQGRVGTPVRCHKGVLYTSTVSMCRAYGVSPSTYSRRIKKGVKSERALKPERVLRAAVDHKGVEYVSVDALVAAYGIDRQSFSTRLRRGWTLEKALTGTINTLES